MGLSVDDSGKLFGYNAEKDLSSNTSLELIFNGPNGLKVTIDSSRISAPAVDAIFDEKGVDTTYLANEYMQFIILSTDFSTSGLTSGLWEVCGIFNNTNTDPAQVLPGPEKTIFINPSCK